MSKKILEIGFNEIKLNKIYADTIEGNISSKKVLEKLGLIHEGIRRKHAFVQTINEYRDFLNYGILIDEYKMN